MRFVVQGRSMEPTFHSGDRLFVSDLYYRLFRPRANDVVVAKDPRTGKLLLKRITKLKNGYYFVQGDNPSKSTDSRQFGKVPRKNIVGKVLFRYFSLHK